MNSHISNNSTTTCRVCLKAGKTTTGCARPGPSCPTVTGFKCGYCKGMGHTIKHCQVLAAKKAAEAHDRTQERNAVKQAFKEGEFICKTVRRAQTNQSKPVHSDNIKTKTGGAFGALEEVTFTAISEPMSAPAAKKRDIGAWGNFKFNAEKPAAAPATKPIPGMVVLYGADTHPTPATLEIDMTYNSSNWGDDDDAW